MARTPRIEVRRNRLTRRYRVVVIGRNGEPLTTSETLNTIDAVNTNIAATTDALAGDPPIEWP